MLRELTTFVKSETMSEDNNDMEVEDILSSIKNILEEDAQNNNVPSNDENTPEAESEDVLDQVLSEDGDIIELSDDMRIAEQNSENDVDTLTIQDGAVEELAEDSPTGSVLAEIDKEESVETMSGSPLIEATPAEEFLSDAGELVSSTQNVDIEEPSEDLSVEQVKESSEDMSVIDPVNEAVLGEETPVIDNTLIENTDSNLNDNQDTLNNSVIDEPVQQTEITTEDLPTIEDVAIEKTNTETEISSNNESLSEEESLMPKEEDTVDASANIINNFAKIFAKKKPQENTDFQADIAPEINGVGNKEKTLEEFVKDSITKVIGEDIARQWNNGADYRNIAENEIKSQVQAWINNNLAMIVEKIVKEEMDRVIAKVGSQD